MADTYTTVIQTTLTQTELIEQLERLGLVTLCGPGDLTTDEAPVDLDIPIPPPPAATDELLAAALQAQAELDACRRRVERILHTTAGAASATRRVDLACRDLRHAERVALDTIDAYLAAQRMGRLQALAELHSGRYVAAVRAAGVEVK